MTIGRINMVISKNTVPRIANIRVDRPVELVDDIFPDGEVV